MSYTLGDHDVKIEQGELLKLLDDLESALAERDRYRRMVDHIYDQMVIFYQHGDEIDINGCTFYSYATIALPDGGSQYLSHPTRKQAEAAWKKAWGLDRI